MRSVALLLLALAPLGCVTEPPIVNVIVQPGTTATTSATAGVGGSGGSGGDVASTSATSGQGGTGGVPGTGGATATGTGGDGGCVPDPDPCAALAPGDCSPVTDSCGADVDCWHVCYAPGLSMSCNGETNRCWCVPIDNSEAGCEAQGLVPGLCAMDENEPAVPEGCIATNVYTSPVDRVWCCPVD